MKTSWGRKFLIRDGLFARYQDNASMSESVKPEMGIGSGFFPKHLSGVTLEGAPWEEFGAGPTQMRGVRFRHALSRGSARIPTFQVVMLDSNRR